MKEKRNQKGKCREARSRISRETNQQEKGKGVKESKGVASEVREEEAGTNAAPIKAKCSPNESLRQLKARLTV